MGFLFLLLYLLEITFASQYDNLCRTYDRHIHMNHTFLQNNYGTSNWSIWLPNDRQSDRWWTYTLPISPWSLTISKVSSFRAYTDIFNNISNVQAICLNDNKLKELPAVLFDNVGNLHLLDLRRNDLESIFGTLLRATSKLRRLDVDDNKITELRKPFFKGLTYLVELNAPRNHIVELGMGVFEDLDSLHSLRLSNNRLTSLRARDFEMLVNLKILTLDDNRLTHIEIGAFEFVYKLKVLRLHGNFLPSLDQNVFRNIINIHDLTVSGNTIICDCRLAWISKLTVKRRYDFTSNYPNALTPSMCHYINSTIEKAAFDVSKCNEYKSIQNTVSLPMLLFTCSGLIVMIYVVFFTRLGYNEFIKNKIIASKSPSSLQRHLKNQVRAEFPISEVNKNKFEGPRVAVKLGVSTIFETVSSQILNSNKKSKHPRNISISARRGKNKKISSRSSSTNYRNNLSQSAESKIMLVNRSSIISNGTANSNTFSANNSDSKTTNISELNMRNDTNNSKLING